MANKAYKQAKPASKKENKLNPMCERYLERRVALVGMSYSGQQIECYAAYEAFDDIDNKASIP